MIERFPAAQDLLGQVWVRDARHHQERRRQPAHHGRHLNAPAKLLRLQCRPTFRQDLEMDLGNRAAHDGQRSQTAGRGGRGQAAKALAAIGVDFRLDVIARQAQQRASHVQGGNDRQGLM